MKSLTRIEWLVRCVRAAGIALLAAACAATAQTPVAPDFPDAPLTFEKHILANGLTLLVHEDHKAPLVSVQVWYQVGSRDEAPGKTGFAHLFEHLMFNGSQHHDDEYFRPLEAAGASLINGTTNTDRTNFFETVPTGALDLALWLESDRMGALLPAVNQAKLDEQRGVVKNEKRQREGQPYAKVDELLTQNLYPAGHPYSWTTIGSMTDLDAASLDDVRQWFRHFYGPNNAVLVMAGDITPAEALAKAERYFGSIPPGPAVTRREDWIAPLDSPRRIETHDRVPQARLYRVWNVPRDADDATVQLDLVAELLAGDKASPLYQRLVTQEGLATAVSADLDARALSSQFGIIISLQPDADPARAEAVLDEMLARFLAAPMPAEALTRHKTAAFVQRMASRESVAGQASELASCQVFQGSPEGCQRQWAALRAATPDSVLATARQWLTPRHLTLIVRPEPLLKAGSGTVDRTRLPAVQEPDGIHLPPLQAFTLDNGITVLLAERHELPLVNLELFWRTGSASQPGPGQFEMLLGMLSEGAAGLDAEALATAYGALGASPGTDLDPDSLGVTLFAPAGWHCRCAAHAGATAVGKKPASAGFPCRRPGAPRSAQACRPAIGHGQRHRHPLAQPEPPALRRAPVRAFQQPAAVATGHARAHAGNPACAGAAGAAAGRRDAAGGWRHHTGDPQGRTGE
jgi:zinc protease